jgi:hypothetical protein
LQDPNFIKAWGEARKYWDVPIEEFKTEDLEQSWDWRDVYGFDFTSPVRD